MQSGKVLPRTGHWRSCGLCQCCREQGEAERDRCAVHIYGGHARRDTNRRRGPKRDHKCLCPSRTLIPPKERSKDPITGFAIPASWIRLCPDPQALQKIQSGRWVILSGGILSRRGLTTGTTAAAACKGAVLSLRRSVRNLHIATPAGIPVSLTVMAKEGFCLAVKSGGDHQSDVTAGLEIVAQARPSEETGSCCRKGNRQDCSQRAMR